MFYKKTQKIILLEMKVDELQRENDRLKLFLDIVSERSTKDKLMNAVQALIDIRNWNDKLTSYWGSKSERARRSLYGLRDEEKNDR